MTELERLKMLLIALKEVDAALVKSVEDELFANQVIGGREVRFVFEMNHEVAYKAIDSSWRDLYSNVVASYVLNDERTPGVIDEEECQLIEKIVKQDTAVAEVEQYMLKHLKDSVKEFPPSLEKLLA
ncbi:MAG: TerB family tellurite resistance protein [Prevotella sp.]|nr:TerB family tellurite resistance protein [Prevotella sp.]